MRKFGADSVVIVKQARLESSYLYRASMND